MYFNFLPLIFYFLLVPASLVAQPVVVPSPTLEALGPEFLFHHQFRYRYLLPELSKSAERDSALAKPLRLLLQASNHFAQEQWDSAFSLYQQARPDIPLLEGQILMRMARCRLAQGNLPEVRSLLLSDQSRRSNSYWWSQAERVLVQAILKDTTITIQARLDSLDARLQVSPAPGAESVAWLQLQRAGLWETTDSMRARDQYIALLGGTQNDSAYRRLRALVSRTGFPADPARRLDLGFAQCRAQHHVECLQSLQAVERTPPGLAVRERLWETRANTYMAMSRWDSAAIAYRFLLDSVQTKPAWMLSLSRSLRRAGRTAEANQWSERYRQRHPFSAEVASNLWLTAFELEQAGKFREAHEAYGKLHDSRFGNNLRRQWAGFRQAFLLYKQGEWVGAAESFRKVSASNPGLWPRSGALLLEADALRRAGRDSLARIAYINTITDFPVGYYAHRARHLLLEHKLLDSALIPWLRTQDLDEAATLAWIRQRDRGAPAADSLFTPTNLLLIETLLRAGFYDEAMDLYEQVRKNNGRRLDFSYQFGNIFLRSGEVARSHRLARQLLDRLDRRSLDRAPRSVMQLLYPLPWKEYVQARVDSTVDYLFVFALIRQESIFDHEITSPAGARGLMQIMPATGAALAVRDNLPFWNVDLLYNPLMSIRLGVRYINELTKEYKKPAWVLANYNAGPGPARRWQRELSHLEWEVAAEEVSFWETRDYIKRVLGNYHTYRAIW